MFNATNQEFLVCGIINMYFMYYYVEKWRSIGKLNSSCPVHLTGTYYCKDSGWK